MIDLSKVKIEKNIPLTSRRGGNNLAALIKQMKAGDSVLLPAALRNYTGTASLTANIKIATRKVNDKEFRLWRME